MIRFYIGFCVCLSIVVLNQIDTLFPIVTEFKFLGRTYSFIEPYTSEDIIWTVVQKLKIVVFSVGVYLIINSITDLIDKKFETQKKKIIKYSNVVLFIIFSIHIYQTAAAVVEWLNEGTVGMLWLVTLVLVVSLTIIIYLFTKGLIRYKNEIKKTAQEKFNNKLSDLSLNFLTLLDNYEYITAISEEMNETHNLKAWKKVIQEEVREMYNNADKFLKQLEGEKTDINAIRRKKEIRS